MARWTSTHALGLVIEDSFRPVDSRGALTECPSAEQAMGCSTSSANRPSGRGTGRASSSAVSWRRVAAVVLLDVSAVETGRGPG